MQLKVCAWWRIGLSHFLYFLLCFRCFCSYHVWFSIILVMPIRWAVFSFLFSIMFLHDADSFEVLLFSWFLWLLPLLLLFWDLTLCFNLCQLLASCIQLSLLNNLYWTLSLSNTSLCFLMSAFRSTLPNMKISSCNLFSCCLWRLLWPGTYFSWHAWAWWSLVLEGVPQSQTFVTDCFVRCMSHPDWLFFGIGL